MGNPEVNEFFSDYTQWEASLKTPSQKAKQEEKKAEQKTTKIKLSYHEKKEYDQIEGTIHKLEEEVKNLNHQLETAAQNPEQLQLICTQIGLAETRIEQLYLRWDELEKKQQGL
jgi:ATP-binding cassette subfamily F protein uup